MKLSLSLKDTDIFKVMLNIIHEVMKDKRVPKEVKQEIKEKLEKIKKS